MSVLPVKWLGICDRCGDPSPEERASEAEAQQDIDDCPCRYDEDNDE